jgi:hypothetical protein
MENKSVTIYTVAKYLTGKYLSINRQKMRKLISGEADTLVHRALGEDGPIVRTYTGQDLKNLLGNAVMNGRVVPDASGSPEVEYFLAPMSDPNGIISKLLEKEKSNG